MRTDQDLDPAWGDLADKVARQVTTQIVADIRSDPPVIQQWVNSATAARHLGMSEKTLEAYRSSGRGPSFVRPNGRIVRYRISELDAWMLQFEERAAWLRPGPAHTRRPVS